MFPKKESEPWQDMMKYKFGPISPPSLPPPFSPPFVPFSFNHFSFVACCSALFVRLSFSSTVAAGGSLEEGDCTDMKVRR